MATGGDVKLEICKMKPEDIRSLRKFCKKLQPFIDFYDIKHSFELHPEHWFTALNEERKVVGYWGATTPDFRSLNRQSAFMISSSSLQEIESAIWEEVRHILGEQKIQSMLTMAPPQYQPRGYHLITIFHTYMGVIQRKALPTHNHPTDGDFDLLAEIDLDRTFDRLYEYDSSVRGIPRDKDFFQKVTTNCSNKLFVIAMSRDPVKIIGYGMISFRVEKHWRIGPLYADSDAVARAIFCNLIWCKVVPGDNVIMNCVASKEETAAWAARFGLRYPAPLHLLATQPIDEFSREKIFCASCIDCADFI